MMFTTQETIWKIFFPILQDLSDTNKFISIDCNEQLKILEYNNTNKFLQYFIEQLYIQLNLLITQTIINCKNIKIINIADNNVLNNSNKFCKIVNIHINKFMVKHNKDYYINNIYTFKDCIYSSIKLSRSQINNTKLITHWLYNLINVSKLLEEKPIRKCGTCAMDSIFNSVYLIEDIKNLMILRPEDYKQNKFYINNIFPPKYEKLCIINIMENKC